MSGNSQYEKKFFPRFGELLRLERKEIGAIYFYAVFNGLIQLTLPLGIQAIIAFVMGGSVSTSLVILISLVVLGVFFTGVIQVSQMKMIEFIKQKVFLRYGMTYISRLPRLNLQSVDGYHLPELVNRFFDSVSLQKGLSKLLLDVPTASLQILFGLLLLSFYHPVFIFFGIFLIIVVFLIMYLTYPKGMKTSLLESDYKYKVAGWLEEVAQSVFSFKFSRNRDFAIQKADKDLVGYLDARTSHFKVLLVQFWSLISFKTVITAGMLIIGSYLLVDQQLSIGQFIAAEIIIILVLNSVEKLVVNIDQVYDVLTSLEKLSKLIEKPVEKDGNLSDEQLGGGLSIKLVDYSVGFSDRHILKNLNLEIKPGEKWLVNGQHGSGKSTLLRALSGALEKYDGTMLINGLPVSNYQQGAFRRSIGLFLNQQSLFTGTIKENITFGDPTVSLSELERLAEVLNLKDYVLSQRDGWETQLDAAGKNISSTVRHKILLMRTLTGSPRLLLLENPYELLDHSEQASLAEYLFVQCNSTIVVMDVLGLYAEKYSHVLYLENGSITKIEN